MARIIYGTVFSALFSKHRAKFYSPILSAAQILREAKICIPHPAAVLLALAVPLCSHREPLRKARKRIFCGVFVRERGKE